MSDHSLYMITLTLETCLWVLMLLNVLVRNLNNTYDKAEMNQILSSETSGSPAHGPSEQTHKYQRNIERRHQTNEIWLYLHRWRVCWVCEAEAGADERVRICLSCSLCNALECLCFFMKSMFQQTPIGQQHRDSAPRRGHAPEEEPKVQILHGHVT